VSERACAEQAKASHGAGQRSAGAPERITIDGIPFAEGRDEVKSICTTQRDEVYVTRYGGSCLRFDLAINNFCGGEVSGVKDISASELDEVRRRLKSVLSTVRVDGR
jgi:hypothetical protein